MFGDDLCVRPLFLAFCGRIIKSHNSLVLGSNPSVPNLLGAFILNDRARYRTPGF